MDLGWVLLAIKIRGNVSYLKLEVFQDFSSYELYKLNINVILSDVTESGWLWLVWSHTVFLAEQSLLCCGHQCDGAKNQTDGSQWAPPPPRLAREGAAFLSCRQFKGGRAVNASLMPGC